MGMHRQMSSELIDELVELQVMVGNAAAGGALAGREHTAIATQLRVVQRAAHDVDAGIRQAVSLLRVGRLTTGTIRATATRPLDDAA